MNNSDIRFYASILWRRLPYIVLATVLGALIGLVGAISLTPVYRATAKVVVEGAEIPAELAKTTVLESAADQLQVIQQEVTTRSNLIKLAEQLKIYDGVEEDMSDDDIVDDMRSRIMFEQENSFQAAGTGTTIFRVSFESTDRQLAAASANELVSIILRKNADDRADQAGATMKFFNVETKRLGDQLAALEAEILSLKLAHSDSLPDSLEFRRSQQARLQEALLLLYREEASLRARRVSISREGFDSAAGATVSVSPERQLLTELARSLSDQQQRYAETSPTIVALRERIAALRAQIAAQDEGGETNTVGVQSSIAPGIAEIDSRLKAIATEREKMNGELAGFTASIAATPNTEKLLNDVTRNRDNIQIQYNAAVAKLGNALTGEKIEMGSKGGKFYVLEEATPPQYAVGPKRRLIAVGGLAGGVGLGMAIVLALELLNKTLRRPSDVVKVLKVQPLATIPFIQPPDIQLRRGHWARLRSASGAAVVIVTASGLLSMDAGSPLQRYGAAPFSAELADMSGYES